MGSAVKIEKPETASTQSRPKTDRPIDRLTEAELEVLRLMGEGLSSQEVASKLGRAVKTVEWHRASLGEKLGVKRRGQLVRIAIEEGLVPVRFRRTDELVLDGDRVQTAEAPGTGQQASAE
jgi:DNA-binding CsgD family transcriptional regulator